MILKIGAGDTTSESGVYLNRLKMFLMLFALSSRIQIFTDLSPATIQRRRSFKPLLAALIQKEIKYWWLFPFSLKFEFTQNFYTFRYIQGGGAFTAEIDLQGTILPISRLSIRNPQTSTTFQPALSFMPNIQVRSAPMIELLNLSGLLSSSCTEASLPLLTLYGTALLFF